MPVRKAEYMYAHAKTISISVPESLEKRDKTDEKTYINNLQTIN